MDQFLNSLPRVAVVMLALVAGLILIFILQPPHTACESQVDIFKNSQAGFIFLDPQKKYQKTLGFQKALDNCKSGNSAGSCLDFFDGMRRLYQDLIAGSSACASSLGGQTDVKNDLMISLELMVHLAWGSQPPRSSFDRLGWLDRSHMGLYCDLKKFVIQTYGQSTWDSFIDEQLKALPMVQILSRNDAWQKSILSFACTEL